MTINTFQDALEQFGRQFAFISSPNWYRRSNVPTVTKTSITIPKGLQINIGSRGCLLLNDVTLDVTSSDDWDDTSIVDYTIAANRKGTDFYIFAYYTENSNEPSFLLSSNSTIPDGENFDEDNTRKIGGFHCLCADVGTISGHALSDYVAGDILPASIWDLLHRAESDNEGMVYDKGTGNWYDIYLAGWDGEQLISQFGATTVDGSSSFPMHGEKFAEYAGKIKKQLINRDDFICVAKGSNEKSNIRGSADAGTTGGHYDTLNRRMISNIGMEDCCGFLWQWCRQDGLANGSSGWGNSVSATPVDASAGLYGQAYGTYYRALVGGGWADGASCGSRSVRVHDVSAPVNAFRGGRLSARPCIVNL